MEVPQATMEVPQATMKVQSCLWVWRFMPWAPLTGHSSCRALPRTAGFPNPSGWRKPKRTQRQQGQKCPVPAWLRQVSGAGSRDSSQGRSWGSGREE